MTRAFDVLVQGGKLFQSLFQNYPVGIFIVDSQGYCLDANPFALHISGYTLEELAEKPVRELLLAEGNKLAASEWDDQNAPGVRELEIRHKHGHAVYVKLTEVPVQVDADTTWTLLTLEDIDQQRKQHTELLNIQDMFSFISQQSQNVISAFSADGTFTYISSSVTDLLGYTPEEVVGKSAVLFNHPEDNKNLAKLRDTLPRHQNTERFTGRVRHKNGDYRWYETTVQYIRDESGAIVQTIGVGRDITERKEAEEGIAYLAYHDPLTDLPNRRLFKERFDLALVQAKHACHCLMLLDLDGFKPVNDSYGHHIGDLLLVEVAKRLTQSVRDGDVVARLGGDEFTILLKNVESLAECNDMIAVIEDAVSQPIFIEEYQLRIHGSIGIALYPEHGDTVSKLMRHADMAMYYAKNTR
ncbi:sensor domain-containing diguanylate cyclase [Alicyclobacillus acidiphilus]|uniref:sensor domain-containing diguanylate cyclase n=1 Tax=Alicyclobacillus acidiphilus TaxID=182455 RepID=UPI000831D433|nr:sensor domain-containing diguanylate cyclase [Alicyclobacillus acidiphilus]